MSHYPVNGENQRPEHDAQGDGANAGQDLGLCHPGGDGPQRDTSRVLLSEQLINRADMTATKEAVGNDLVLGLKGLDVNSPSTNATETKEPRIGVEQITESGELATEEDRLFTRERRTVLQYLLDNAAEFRELSEIRLKARIRFLSHHHPGLQTITDLTPQHRAGRTQRATDTLSGSVTSPTTPTTRRARSSWA